MKGRKVKKINISNELSKTLIVILIALLAGYILIFLTGLDWKGGGFFQSVRTSFQQTGEAYEIFLSSPLFKLNRAIPEFNFKGFVQWINQSVPIILTGLAVSLVFSAGIFNLGAEGQMFAGAVGGTFTAILFPAIPVIHAFMVILTGIICGMAVAAIPASIKYKLRGSEIVSSLMMNYIALYIGLLLIRTFLRDEISGALMSRKFRETARLFLLNERYKWHIGIFIAIGVTMLIWFIMNKTTWGYKLRVTGANKTFANYSGIPSTRMVFQTQLLSGSIAGMAGIIVLAGYHGRFLWVNSPGYGWDGVIVALVAGQKPLLVLPAALFISYIRVGATTMGRYTEVSPEIIAILQAIIILLITAKAFLANRPLMETVRSAMPARREDG